MTIETFAEQHRLRLRRDDCGEHFVPCRRGQIFDHGDGHFGVMILDGSPRAWGNARRAMEAVYFQVTQDGDSEGIGLFDPEDAKQVSVAFKVMQPRRRKNLSEEHLAKLRQNAKLARSVRKTLYSGASGGQGSIATLA